MSEYRQNQTDGGARPRIERQQRMACHPGKQRSCGFCSKISIGKGAGGTDRVPAEPCEQERMSRKVQWSQYFSSEGFPLPDECPENFLILCGIGCEAACSFDDTAFGHD